MYLYIMIAAVFVAVFVFILALGLPALISKRAKKKITQIDHYGTSGYKGDEEEASFYERVARPFFIKASNIVKKMNPAGIGDSTRKNLELSGLLDTMGIDVFLGLKLLIPIGFLFLSIILVIFIDMHLMFKILLILLVPFTYLIPDIFVKSKIAQRQEEIRLALPNALDLLTISIEAGMGFNIALSKVAGQIKGALGQEFEKMLQDIQVGASRKEAFKNLDRRTDVPDLSTFIVAMTQAEVFGVSVGKVLRVQAVEMRVKRRQRAEEAGAKAPLKLVFPLILCLFPALLTVILGPAAIRIFSMFAQM